MQDSIWGLQYVLEVMKHYNVYGRKKLYKKWKEKKRNLRIEKKIVIYEQKKKY